MEYTKLGNIFFNRDILEVASDLPGKILTRQFEDGSVIRLIINDIEIYRGEEDLACHASKGRTSRTEVMYHEGGKLYVYLIYGMYWMLNIVAGPVNSPQAILIRGAGNFNGPGKLTKFLKIDKSFYGEELGESSRIWIEDTNIRYDFHRSKRIGIEYASKHWRNIEWRYFIKP